MTKHHKISKEEKAKIVLTVLRGDKTVNEIAAHYSVHPTLISRWKQTATEGLSELFEDKRRKVDQSKYQEQVEQIERLQKMVGQREMELDWLKKKLSVFDDDRQTKISRSRQP